MIQCPRCGNVDRIGKASVIVENETYYSTEVRGAALANGQYGSYLQNVTSQSELARNLTADEPKKGTGCWGNLLVISLLSFPTLGILLSCSGLAYMNGPDSLRTQLMIYLLVSVLVFIALIVISVIVSHQQKNSFNRRHNNWYNMFDRRYYCGSCGTCFQI